MAAEQRKRWAGKDRPSTPGRGRDQDDPLVEQVS